MRSRQLFMAASRTSLDVTELAADGKELIINPHHDKLLNLSPFSPPQISGIAIKNRSRIYIHNIKTISPRIINLLTHH